MVLSITMMAQPSIMPSMLTTLMPTAKPCATERQALVCCHGHLGMTFSAQGPGARHSAHSFSMREDSAAPHETVSGTVRPSVNLRVQHDLYGMIPPP